MASPIITKLSKALGAKVVKSRALSGGDIADLSLLTLNNHTEVVAKRPRVDQPDTTAIETLMLKHLADRSQLPVPKVLFTAPSLLVMSYIPHKGTTEKTKAAKSVAAHVAALHQIRPKGKSPYYGFTKDTFIGPLPQINTPESNWCSFFTDHRLYAMAHSCMNVSKIDTVMMRRIETLAGKLPDILPATPESSLLHGDLWSGNILIDGDKASGFIDPAISYGHHEMDLAFIALMGGLDPVFFDTYTNHYKIDAGFHEERKSLYQLWPLLVHVRLFGGNYRNSVSAILEQFGC